MQLTLTRMREELMWHHPIIQPICCNIQGDEKMCTKNLRASRWHENEIFVEGTNGLRRSKCVYGWSNEMKDNTYHTKLNLFSLIQNRALSQLVHMP